MGSLRYDGERFEIDDRTLAHVQQVIVSKLRKSEPFLLSWTVAPEHGSGRVALWIESGIPIGFRHDGSRPARINRAWLEAMVQQSYTTNGLELMPESDHPEPSAD